MDSQRAQSLPGVARSHGRADRGLRWFILTAYGLSYAGQAVIWATGGLDGEWFVPVASLLMFTPTVAAFVATRVEGVAFLGLLRPRARSVPLLAGVLVPAASALIAAFVIAGRLGGAPAPWRAVPGGFAVAEGSPFLWGGTLGATALLANVVLTAGCLSVLAGVLAVGEEIGWRGYLQPRLCQRLGTTPGLVAVGLLWAFWHLPVLLMGYTFPAAPILGGLLLFPVIGVALSFFLGWLRRTTGGIWAPALAHGSYNAFFGTLVFEMDFAGHAVAAYLVVVSLTVLTGLACLPLVHRHDKPCAPAHSRG